MFGWRMNGGKEGGKVVGWEGERERWFECREGEIEVVGWMEEEMADWVVILNRR